MKTIISILCWTIVSFNSPALLHANSIIDSSGQTITFAKPFKRIISLYPAHTENLFSLGLDSEIIGVAKGDDFPSQVRNKSHFHYREDPERFIAAKPDLVLVRPMIMRAYPELIKKLQLFGIVVVSLQPTNITDTFAYWQKLGLLTGREKEATKMVTSFKKKLAKISAIGKAIPVKERKRVYFEAIHSKMKTFAPTSMAIFALQSAGGINIAQDAIQVRNSNIAAYGKEKILSHAAEIDIFLAQKGRMNRITPELIYNEPGFKTIKALKNRQVYIVDEKIVSRPTMRMLEGIKEIQQILTVEYSN